MFAGSPKKKKFVQGASEKKKKKIFFTFSLYSTCYLKKFLWSILPKNIRSEGRRKKNSVRENPDHAPPQKIHGRPLMDDDLDGPF